MIERFSMMEYTRTEFKKLKNRMYNMEIVPAINDRFDVGREQIPPQPDNTVFASSLWPHFKGGEGVFSNTADEFFEPIYIEIEENLKLPVALKQKQEYLNEILEFALTVDSRVIENDDGAFSTDLFTIDFSEYSDALIDSRSPVQSFILGIRKNSRKLILYLHRQLERLEIFEKQSISDTMELNRPRTFSLIKKPGTVYDSKLPEAYEMLVDYGFISPDTSKKNFLNLFHGKELESPIVWLDSKGSLRYFLSQIEGSIIEKLGRNKWKLFCSVFSNKQQGVEFDLASLRGAKSSDISERNKKNLDRILEFLLK